MAVAQDLVAAASGLNVKAVLLFVVVLLLTVVYIRRPRNLPPGPRAWPILGNLRQLLGRQLYVAFSDWAKKYGSIMSVWMGPRLVIVLSDIHAIKEALGKQADCFSDRPEVEGPLPTKGMVFTHRKAIQV